MKRKPLFFMVHGIRAKDHGASSMGLLARLLNQSFSFVKQVIYGYVLVPITNKKAVQAVVEAIGRYKDYDGDVVVVGYSNGAWAAVQAAEMGHKIDHLVLISPALHRSHAIPEHVKHVSVFYCPDDSVVGLGAWYRRVVNLMPWNWEIFGGDPHDWGAMGKYGYVGNDKRVTNYKMSEGVGHFWFKNEKEVMRIASFIETFYEDHRDK